MNDVLARKKPVEVHVYQFKKDSFWTQDVRNKSWPDWLRKAIDDIKLYPVFLGDSAGRTFISTLEGRMEVTDGDWIIQGVHGELYPCKADIFEKTYDIVRNVSGLTSEELNEIGRVAANTAVNELKTAGVLEDCPTCGASPGDECRGCDESR